MIFKLRVFLRLLQLIFGSAHRTSPYLFQLIAAYLKLRFGFGTRKWAETRSATEARNASNSSKKDSKNTCKSHTAGHRLSLFRSTHFSKFSSGISRLSSKALAKVKSIEHARKYFTSAGSPERFPKLSLSSTSSASKVTFVVPSTNPAKTETKGKIIPNMEAVLHSPSVEAPEFWRKISTSVRAPERTPLPEWQVQGRRRRNGMAKKLKKVTKTEEATPEKVPLAPVHSLSSEKSFPSVLKNVPGSFYTFENPYKVLEELGEEAYQLPQFKQRNCSTMRQSSQPAKKPTQNRTDISPIPTLGPASTPKLIEAKRTFTVSPIKIPGISLVWNSTQILAHGTERPASSVPEPVKYNAMVEDLDVARIINNRRRQKARSPTQTLKRAPMLTPRDTVESFRKASSPPRSVSPTTPDTQNNEWQPVQKRSRRATGYKADIGRAPIPDLRPKLVITADAGTDMVRKGASPVILYKTKRPATTVSA